MLTFNYTLDDDPKGSKGLFLQKIKVIPEPLYYEVQLPLCYVSDVDDPSEASIPVAFLDNEARKLWIRTFYHPYHAQKDPPNARLDMSEALVDRTITDKEQEQFSNGHTLKYGSIEVSNSMINRSLSREGHKRLWRKMGLSDAEIEEMMNSRK